jgi:hypothetical protein
LYTFLLMFFKYFFGFTYVIILSYFSKFFII